MEIHSSAKFSNKEISFHNVFSIDFEPTKESVTNLAISRFKKKCETYFKINFSEMIFFEVYYFKPDGKEIQLFTKKKS